MESMIRLRLILGDQLNTHHSWFDTVDENTYYLFAEMSQEAASPEQHIQKIVAFFNAMRAMAHTLKTKGHKVIYQSISEHPERSLQERIHALAVELQIDRFEYQLPDDYRLDQELLRLSSALNAGGIRTSDYDTEHFYTHRYELQEFFGEKSLLMERFYRAMRKKHRVLMQGDKPIGGQWNFDKENRKSYDHKVAIKDPLAFHHDVRLLCSEIDESGIPHFGSIEHTDFNWPRDYKEAMQLLDYFCQELLPHFGTYQDALYSQHRFLFHSRLSFAMNAKIISPRKVIDKVIATYENDTSRVTLPQLEGFIRQILGWREFMRGVYWKEMPGYKSLNYFNHKRPLPDFYWTGKTKMRCVAHAVEQTMEDAYAHHIQRLMVTGNFGLLAEIDPDALDRWYLGVYADAIEWVEITNTRGMSQYADGGIIATKPYISSANYIDKMSDYCKSCHFSPKEKTGEKACPFNALYWNFLLKKREVLQGNQRMSMMYRILDKKSSSELEAYTERAEQLLADLDGTLGK